uniref:Ankyrin repeat domain-containing protein n=1 Tax=Pyramimonas obovata TaxID=1411642 RepID=A0A7S0RPP2_9CHLO
MSSIHMPSLSRYTAFHYVASISFVIVGCLTFAHGQAKDIHGALMFAAGEGNSKLVEDFLASGADVNHRNEYGETPLHVSAIKGDLDTIKAILAAGAKVNAQANAGSPIKQTPLHWMVYPDHKEGVKLLLAAGADPNIQNEDGETPLDMALHMGTSYKEMAKILEQAGGKPSTKHEEL